MKDLRSRVEKEKANRVAYINQMKKIKAVKAASEVPLSEYLKALETMSTELTVDGQKVVFKIDYGRVQSVDGVPEPKVTVLEFKDLEFSRLLKYLSEQCGMKYSVDGRRVEFWSAEAVQGGLETRKFRLSGKAISRSNSEKELTNKDIEYVLRECGIPFGPYGHKRTGVISYDSGTDSVTIIHDVAYFKNIERVIKVLNGNGGE